MNQTAKTIEERLREATNLTDLRERIERQLDSDGRKDVRDIFFVLASLDRERREAADTIGDLRELQQYGAAVCFANGHVRSGVGSMDRCSRCGIPVTDAMMTRSRKGV